MYCVNFIIKKLKLCNIIKNNLNKYLNYFILFENF